MASRDPDAAEVYDVVTKIADRNPQKLRQIGMNYDIANSKGVVEVSPEEKKKKEQKKKDAQEKKRKEKEDAEKEKAEFEVWKKEKREREEKEKAEKAEKEKADKEQVEKENAKENAEEHLSSKETEEVKESATEASNEDKGPGGASGHDSKMEPGSKDDGASSNEVAQDTPLSDDSQDPKPVALRPPPSGYGGSGPPSPTFGAAPRRYYAASDAGAAPPPPPKAAAENKQNPWNAVCVLGLRVYSKDPEVSIRLIKPKDAEEGAVLDADGATQAGATM